MSLDDEIAKFGPERISADATDSEFAAWVATLDASLDPNLKAKATKRLLEMFLMARMGMLPRDRPATLVPLRLVKP